MGAAAEDPSPGGQGASALTISVVMATYQGERYLTEQLDSLAAQTLRPAELVVSDDGSTDGTWNILTSFSDSAPFPVRLHRNASPVGWVENFFTALGRASCPLIAFADQDDVWLATKLDRMRRPFRAPDVQLVVCASRATDEQLHALNRARRTGIISRALLAGPLISPTGNCMLGRRDLLHKLPPVGRPLPLSGPVQSHDEWFLFAAQCFGRVVHVRQPLVLYRRHSETVTAAQAERPRRRWLDPPAHSELGHLVEVCRSRGEFVGQAAISARGDEPAEHQRALQRERLRYARLQAGLERRLEIAAACSRPRRALRLLGAVVRGRYSWQRRGGLGWLALVQDAHSVLRPPPGADQPRCATLPP